MPEQDPLDDYIAASARVLDLAIEEAWLPSVKMNLKVILENANRVAQFELPDETEPAPTFRP